MKDCVLAKAPEMRLADVRRAFLLTEPLTPAAVFAAADQRQAYDQSYDAESTHDR
jgi:hypothetical protein